MRSGIRLSVAVAGILMAALVAGCSTYDSGTSITYSYEPLYSFSGLTSYRWAETRPSPWGDPLVDSNVRFVANQVLTAKGLTLRADKPDLVISTSYGFAYGYELRTLVIDISRADKNELVWRGMASGSIRTDASSADLRKAVEGVLANFPPASSATR